MAHAKGDEEKHELKPASECVWYVLATIAGEVNTSHHYLETLSQNRYYWNGIMRERSITHGAEVKTHDGASAYLPQLNDDDRAKIRQALESRGFSVSDAPNDFTPIDFSNVALPSMTTFDGFAFVGETTFDGAIFSGPFIGFRNSMFASTPTFKDADFRGRFLGLAINFAGGVHFNKARFSGPADFGHSVFGADAEFNGAQFGAGTRFNSCAFTYDVRFDDAVFEDRIDFRYARFEGQTHFRKTHFKALVPECFEATLHEYTVWTGAKWPDTHQNPAVAPDHIQGYQCLAREMNRLEKPADQRFFIRQEMRTQRALERWVIGRRLRIWNFAFVMNWAYEKICGYGYGLTRASLWWFLHWLAGAVLLCVSNIFPLMDGLTFWQASRESFAVFGSAAKVSFGNALGVLDLNDRFFADAVKNVECVPWFEGIGVAQTILGVILLFFLLLTIRNLFRIG